MRPRMFIGSSTEALPIARLIQEELTQDAEVLIWNQGAFRPGQTVIEGLLAEAIKCDFALFVFKADDLAIIKGQLEDTARDNVVFELGYFLGLLGKSRVFYLYDETQPPRIPSDLGGITALRYLPWKEGVTRAALGPLCNVIRREVTEQGFRESRMLETLSEVTVGVKEFELKAAKMLNWLARSRRIELEVIMSNFGPLMPSASREQIIRDLNELEAMTRDQGEVIPL